MSFKYEEKTSSLPHVDVVWRTEDLTDGVYIASADACWDLIFIQTRAGGARVLLSGPSTKITPVSYTAGNQNFGVRFKPGIIFNSISAAGMLDVTQSLPMPSSDTFVLQGITWKVPTYECIDEFIAGLVQRGLLSQDPVVRDFLENKPFRMTARSIQRHFAVTVGMSPRRVRQITCARKAVELLLRGMSLADVAYELGYADLPHMVRMLKRFTGFTPLANQKRGQSV